MDSFNKYTLSTRSVTASVAGVGGHSLRLPATPQYTVYQQEDPKLSNQSDSTLHTVIFTEHPGTKS